MTEPEDRSTPPPSPPASPGQEPQKPAEVWLPPRLRDRLASSQEPEPKASPMGAILGIVTILIVIGGVWWLVATNKAKAAAATKAAAVAAAAQAAAEADSL